MQISKSEFMMFLKHPAWLWLKKHKKDKLPEPDENLQAIFDAGHEFEKYANKRFPDGVEISFDNYNDYLSMPKRTKEALDDGAKTIFQGRFETQYITCICDILDRVEGDTFDLYEVKSSTKVKKEHIPDLAFQTIVLEGSGIKVRNIAVVHVNNDYVRDGEVDPVKLSSVTDITTEVRDSVEETKLKIKEALKVTQLKEIPDISPRYTDLGSFNDWMDIYKILKDVDEYSIYNLIAPGKNRIGQLEDMEIDLIKDIPYDFDLTSKQLAQVKATKEDQRILNKDYIKKFLNDLTYPLYFLDYETAMSAIPLYDGTKPYQQIPFQYSLHTVEAPGGEIKHSEYLHRDKSNPVPSLLEKLREDIGDKGSVIVWYKAFETRRNEEMGEAVPKYQEFLEGVNSRVVDLMEPFSNGWFVDKKFKGSSSIKNVLPVLAPDLSYKDLEVQEGGAAQRLWMDNVYKGDSSKDNEKLFSDLIEYCKLDTLAMVKIWESLNNL